MSTEANPAATSLRIKLKPGTKQYLQQQAVANRRSLTGEIEFRLDQEAREKDQQRAEAAQ